MGVRATLDRCFAPSAACHYRIAKVYRYQFLLTIGEQNPHMANQAVALGLRKAYFTHHE